MNSIHKHHPSLDGLYPVYCPNVSGNLSLIFHTQHDGITLLSPAPRWPNVHRMYCWYVCWPPYGLAPHHTLEYLLAEGVQELALLRQV